MIAASPKRHRVEVYANFPTRRGPEAASNEPELYFGLIHAALFQLHSIGELTPPND